MLGQHPVNLCLVEGCQQASRQRAQAVQRPALVYHVPAKLSLHGGADGDVCLLQQLVRQAAMR
jgi:hypothetical protein